MIMWAPGPGTLSSCALLSAWSGLYMLYIYIYIHVYN